MHNTMTRRLSFKIELDVSQEIRVIFCPRGISITSVLQTVDSVGLLPVPAAQVAGLPPGHQAAQPQGAHHLPLEAPFCPEDWTELAR